MDRMETEEEKKNTCDNCDYEGPEEEGAVCPECGVGEMVSKEDLEEENEEDELGEEGEGLEDMNIKDLGEELGKDEDLE